MTRTLPWKNGTSTKGLPRNKGKSKDDNAEREPSDDASAHDPQALEDKDDSHKEQSDDDENYRITESEFVDTARYFTRDLHQQAYERLLQQQQQKEIESKNTISDLLAQPMPRSEIVSVPPPPPEQKSVLKAKSMDLSSGVKNNPSVKLSEPSHLLGMAPSKGPHSEKQNGLSSDVKANKPLLKDAIKPTSETKQTIPPKLSDAATARRRKRQEAQKADVAVDPFVW